jgi:single-stranded-DNA-specific exonuclease
VTESALHNETSPYLGVARSVLGRAWNERCDAGRSTIALAIAQTHGLPDVLARVLAGRGVSVQDAPGFLSPRLRDLLPDPHCLTGMEAAAARLADAVQRGETVAIFGDYDVDGACSAALLAEYLRRCGVPSLVHIPDRITEGYGPNAEAIRSLKGQGAGLLVTVDCGTASHEPLAEAGRLGLDVVVLDHHQAPERLPPALALVNPNRQDDLSGLGQLCAAGVVFLALVALNRTLRNRGFFAGRVEPDLLASLDLVALATVADVVPLTGLNRAFV